MKLLKNLGMSASLATVAGAIVKYWKGDILEALFWMSVASAMIILNTEIKE